MTLKAPFPWFGGKSRAAHLVWRGFGDVANYVEPFAGSLAVLLGRPTAPRIETVNDLDCMVANFWRAVTAAPEEVARWADWPVNEADLHARHRWLVAQADFRERMKREPDFYDAKVAGWWCWGLCQWIGGGWCASPEWEGRTNGGRKGRGVHAATATTEENRRPASQRMGILTRGAHTSENEPRPSLNNGQGVHAQRMRDLAGAVLWHKRPVLDGANRGVHLVGEQLPNLGGDSGAAGHGVHASGLAKMPRSDRGTDSRLQTPAIFDWMQALSIRLRRVRVCCGDWKRVLGRASTECIGTTGILLDPPYGTAAGRDPSLYAHDSLDVAAEVRAWALEHGDNPKLRIALCGYEGEHDMPETWECVAWKAGGGYAAAAGNHDNAKRERIWFSPACADVERQHEMFAEAR